MLGPDRIDVQHSERPPLAAHERYTDRRTHLLHHDRLPGEPGVLAGVVGEDRHLVVERSPRDRPWNLARGVRAFTVAGELRLQVAPLVDEDDRDAVDLEDLIRVARDLGEQRVGVDRPTESLRDLEQCDQLAPALLAPLRSGVSPSSARAERSWPVMQSPLFDLGASPSRRLTLPNAITSPGTIGAASILLRDERPVARSEVVHVRLFSSLRIARVPRETVGRRPGGRRWARPTITETALRSRSACRRCSRGDRASLGYTRTLVRRAARTWPIAVSNARTLFSCSRNSCSGIES